MAYFASVIIENIILHKYRNRKGKDYCLCSVNEIGMKRPLNKSIKLMNNNAMLISI